MKFKNILWLTLSILSACGGGSSSETTTTTVITPATNTTTGAVIKATVTSVGPTSNVIAGIPSASFTVFGSNLLGVNFKLGDNNCATNRGTISGPSQLFQLTIRCDVPSTPTGTTSLSIRESTNGSEVSDVAGTTIALVSSSTLPTLTAVSPLTVKPGSEFVFTIAGTHINSFAGRNNSLGVQYNGKSLSCAPLIGDSNADNTSGTIANCMAPTTLGSGQLRWFFNADKGSVDFGTLTVAN